MAPSKQCVYISRNGYLYVPYMCVLIIKVAFKQGFHHMATIVSAL